MNQQWIRLEQYLGATDDYYVYMERRFRNPEGADAAEARAALEQFSRRCEERQVPVGMILFPKLVPDYPLGFLLDRVLDTCAEFGIRCLDMRETLAQHTEESWWVNRFGAHPIAFVNRVAAEALMANLRRAETVKAARSARAHRRCGASPRATSAASA